MATNNLHIQSFEENLIDIDDQRWRKNKAGVSETGENGSLIIEEAAKEQDGGHRVGAYLVSGVPVYRDIDAEGFHVVKVFNEAAKTAGHKVAGFTQSINRIMDINGQYFDRIPVGIQTGGEIYPDWLPVDLEAEDIPVRFGTSPL